MKKIFLDIGHGGTDGGATAADGTPEKVINLNVVKRAYALLNEDPNFEVKASRTGDTYLTLRERADMANAWGADVFISIHHNACNKQASGAELIHTIFTDKSQGDEIAGYIAEEFKSIGQDIRRIFSKKDDATGLDWYGVIRYTNMPSVITEFAFIDNLKDYQKIDEPSEYDAEATAIYSALCKYYGFNMKGTSILGNSTAVIYQMDTFLRRVNPDAPDVAQIYIDEGNIEGVRGDMAFAQAIKETNYFRFTGIAKPEWNNPAGLGVTGAANVGNRFPDWKTGIRAQIQHLKGYASKAPLSIACVDQRYEVLKENNLLGTAPNWEDLNGKWAVPGPTYGQDIIKILESILLLPVPEPVTVDSLLYEFISELKSLIDKYERKV